MRRGGSAALKNGRGTADGGQWARAHGGARFRPEVCSGRGMIALGAKNLTPQRGELQKTSGGMSDLTLNESAPTSRGAATPIPHMPLPLRKANRTLKGDNSLAGNSGGKRQEAHGDRGKRQRAGLRGTDDRCWHRGDLCSGVAIHRIPKRHPDI